jgi:sugar lactone lactonase YvrE
MRLLPFLLLIPVLAAGPVFGDPTFSLSPTPFSPGQSPGVKDAIRVDGYLDQTVPVTTTITNSGGVIVRTLPPTEFNYAYGAILNRSSWDGRDHSAGLVPDGAYTFRFATQVGKLWSLGNAHRDHRGQFDQPCGAAVAEDGKIYVAELGAGNRIQVFDKDRNFLFFVRYEDHEPGHLGWATSVAAKAGKLYVMDVGYGKQNIKAYDAGTGAYLFEFGGKGTADGKFDLDWKNGLAIDPLKRVWVVDSGNDRVQVFDQDGGYLFKFGSSGTASGQFNFIGGFGDIAIDSDGYVYITDGGTMGLGRIQVFNSSGAYQRSILTAYEGGPGELLSIRFVAVGPKPDKRIYVATQVQFLSGDYELVVLKNNGAFLTKWGNHGRETGDFSWIRGMAVAPAGLLAAKETLLTVEHYENNRVQAFDPDGNLLFKIGVDRGEFLNPEGIALGPGGRIYVADSDNGRIQVFNPDGTFQFEILVPYEETLTLLLPSRLAVASDGRIYAGGSQTNPVGPTQFAFKIFGSSGDILRSVGNPPFEDLTHAGGLAIAGTGPATRLFVTQAYEPSFGKSRVHVFDLDGNFKFSFGTHGTGPGELNFDNQSGAVASFGNELFFLDKDEEGNGRVQVFDTNGSYLRTIPTDCYQAPTAVAVDMMGNVYLSDCGAGVSVFDPTGNLLYTFGDFDYDSGESLYPSGVAVDASRNLYVTDSMWGREESHRLFKYSTTAEVLLGTAACEIDNTLPAASFTYPPRDPGHPFPLTGPITAEGTAKDRNFESFKLQYADHGTGSFHDIPPGEVIAPVDNGPLGTVDGSGLSGGIYDLRLYVKDRAGNVNTDTVTFYLDRSSPESSVSPLLEFVKNTSFTVTWSGTDTGVGSTGIRSFDIQYRDGETGEWMDWLSGATDTSSTFHGQNGHTYFFRSRALDWADNVEDFPSSPDAHVLVDTSKPAFAAWDPPEGFTGFKPSIWASLTDPSPGSGVDPATVSVVIDGTPETSSYDYNPRTGKISIRLNFSAGGAYTITIRVSDRAGNEAAPLILHYRADWFVGKKTDLIDSLENKVPCSMYTCSDWKAPYDESRARLLLSGLTDGNREVFERLTMAEDAVNRLHGFAGEAAYWYLRSVADLILGATGSEQALQARIDSLKKSGAGTEEISAAEDKLDTVEPLLNQSLGTALQALEEVEKISSAAAGAGKILAAYNIYNSARDLLDFFTNDYSDLKSEFYRLGMAFLFDASPDPPRPWSYTTATQEFLNDAFTRSEGNLYSGSYAEAQSKTGGLTDSPPDGSLLKTYEAKIGTTVDQVVDDLNEATFLSFLSDCFGLLGNADGYVGAAFTIFQNWSSMLAQINWAQAAGRAGKLFAEMAETASFRGVRWSFEPSASPSPVPPARRLRSYPGNTALERNLLALASEGEEAYSSLLEQIRTKVNGGDLAGAKALFSDLISAGRGYTREVTSSRSPSYAAYPEKIKSDPAYWNTLLSLNQKYIASEVQRQKVLDALVAYFKSPTTANKTTFNTEADLALGKNTVLGSTLTAVVSSIEGVPKPPTVIVSSTASPKKVAAGEVFSLQALLKNTGPGTAHRVRAEISANPSFNIRSSLLLSLGDLDSGQEVAASWSIQCLNEIGYSGIWIRLSSEDALTLDHTVSVWAEGLPSPSVTWVEVAPKTGATYRDILIQAHVMDTQTISYVKAHIRDAETGNGVKTVTLYDNGSSSYGDEKSNDQIYTNKTKTPSIAGDFYVTIEAKNASGYITFSGNQSGFTTRDFVRTGPFLLVSDYADSYLTRAGVEIIPAPAVFPSSYYVSAFQENGLIPDIWRVPCRGIPDTTVTDPYLRGIMFWASGALGTGTIGRGEIQDLLQDHLSKGGSLFLSGQDVGWLVTENGLVENTFYNTPLGSAFKSYDSGMRYLKGIDGDPVAGGMDLAITGGDGANNQLHPDGIRPIGTGIGSFQYVTAPGETPAPENPYGAVRIEGTYRLLYLSFGFEAIADSEVRAALLKKALAYLHDYDRDGMPDYWEEAKGLDPFDPADAGKDPDGDGLTNFEEFGLGTDPSRADTDSDGMPDGWEASYRLNPLGNDAGADKDGDGFTNLQEYLAGTDPSDPSSNPGLPTLAWTGESGYGSDGLHPENGSITTSFVFRVLYKSLSNKAPLAGYPRVHIRNGAPEIAGSPYPMTKASGDYPSGAVFQFSRTLPLGSYTYFFEAVDADGRTATGAPVSEKGGPIVTDTPPAIPSNPVPSDGATEVSLTPVLSWSSFDPDPGDSVTFDLYFGTMSTPVAKVSADQVSASFAPGGLLLDTTYYWKVVARDNHGEQKEGPVWSFRTLSDNAVPEVSIEGLSLVQADPVFDIGFAASDTASGVAFVRLFYRKDGETWTRYGIDTAVSPISFDSGATGGDGNYEFRAEATDRAGNTAESAIAKTLVKTTGLILTGVAPDPFGLGAVLTLSGEGFGAKKGTVLLGDSLKPKVLAWTDTSISCSVTKGTAGRYPLKVIQKGAGESNLLECTLSPPFIEEISTDEGTVNTPVTISGKHFGMKKPKVQFILGEIRKSAKVISYSETSLTALVPKLSPGSYGIQILNGAGTSQEMVFGVK